MTIKAFLVAITLGSASLAAVQPASAEPVRAERFDHRAARGERREIRRDHRFERRDGRNGWFHHVTRERPARGRFARGRYARGYRRP